MRGRWVWGLAGYLLAGCTGEPAPFCPTEIPSQRAAETGTPLAWSDDAQCIVVVYTPDLRDREQIVIDAANAWTSIPCNRTCFDAPAERSLPDDGVPLIGVIHFAAKEPGGAERTRTQNAYRAETATLWRSKILIDPTLPDEELRRVALLGFGRAVGFDTPTSSVASVLQPTVDDGLTEPTEADRVAFCAKYGECIITSERR